MQYMSNFFASKISCVLIPQLFLNSVETFKLPFPRPHLLWAVWNTGDISALCFHTYRVLSCRHQVPHGDVTSSKLPHLCAPKFGFRNMFLYLNLIEKIKFCPQTDKDLFLKGHFSRNCKNLRTCRIHAIF